MKRILTFGAYDLFHIGHLKILQRASKYGELYVGVYTNNGVFNDKKKKPIIDEKQRLEIVQNIKCVKEAFLIENIRLKEKYATKYKADIIVHGDDHKDNKIFKKLEKKYKVIYLPRTKEISTTEIIIKITK